jgi:molybdate transport system substrate-binding protein
MGIQNKAISRRGFLTGAATATMGATIAATVSAKPSTAPASLKVWSCGGLAEAFIPANARYKEKSGVEIAYTGAFAAALGKSLLGSAETDVFAGRVLGLAKKLRQAKKMIYFKPLCFTRYVLVTPPGNPAGITSIGDVAKPGVRVILAPQASPPGGKAVSGLLKKAGVADAAMNNTVIRGSCVQRTMARLVQGQGDVSVVEYRLTRLPQFREKVEVIDIPEAYFPSAPLSFTVGVMQFAKDRERAGDYIDFILSEEGQTFFKSAGFIPAISRKGREMIARLGVKDA